MTPILAAVDIETLAGITIPIVSLLIVIMTAILTSHRRKVLCDDMEATLKMEMIQRGMSAEEIERVLAARFGKPSRYPARPQAQQQMQHQHQH